jgi:hypothetical protein
MFNTLFILLSGSLIAGAAGAWEARPGEEDQTRHIVIGGDMLFKNPHGRTRRALIDPLSTRFWPGNTIPYSLTHANAATRALFRQAIHEIHTKTRVRFVPRRHQRDYIKVETVPDLRCRAMTGYTGGAQLFQISSDPVCATKSAILHELAHALGFVHEHNRPDRDQYIEVRWQNVQEHGSEDLAIEHTSLARGPYDYDSVTHYPAYVLSQNGRPTLWPRDPAISPARLGNRPALSDGDVRMINLAYPARSARARP